MSFYCQASRLLISCCGHSQASHIPKPVILWPRLVVGLNSMASWSSQFADKRQGEKNPRKWDRTEGETLSSSESQRPTVASNSCPSKESKYLSEKHQSKNFRDKSSYLESKKTDTKIYDKSEREDENIRSSHPEEKRNTLSSRENPRQTYPPSSNSLLDSAERKRQRVNSTTEDRYAASSSSSYHTSHKKWCNDHKHPHELTHSERRWDQVSRAPGRGDPGMAFTVMSYNILAQDLLEGHRYLYSQCRAKHLNWGNRGQAILRQIIEHDADVVCLQEVQAGHWKKMIKPKLFCHGYTGIYQKRTGQDKPDGCAILFKSHKFSLVEQVPVCFLQAGILNRDNVGLIVKLQPNRQHYDVETEHICVATTHLLFNPRRGDVKLAQMMLFLAEIDKVAALRGKDQWTQGGFPHMPGSTWTKQTEDKQRKLEKESDNNNEVDIQQKHNPSNNASATVEGEKTLISLPPTNYCPIILCGDFNTEPFSDMYRFLTKGHLKYQGLIPRLICGQQEGQLGGSNEVLSSFLLQTKLPITESCQYRNVLYERFSQYVSVLKQQEKVGKSIEQSTLQESHKVEQPEGAQSNTESQTPTSQKFSFDCPKVNSGQAYHTMNFKSVYSHRSEVTSHHNRCSCTLDYILYSNSRSPTIQTETLSSSLQHQHLSGRHDDYHTRSSRGWSHREDRRGKPNELKLLARYSLLSSQQVWATGPLPHAVFPSDHLCLIARFLVS